MAGFENDVVYAKNADFTQADNQAPTEANGLATNGQLWIGTTALNAGSTHINVGSITSPDLSVVVGYSSPNITLTAVGVSPTTFDGDTGSANPVLNTIILAGGTGITTSASGNTVTFDIDGTSVGETITGTTGGPLSPTAGNWNILAATVAAGTTPIATAGAVSTLTINVQRSQAIASTDVTKIGLANFNSSQFTVDANGFVGLKGSTTNSGILGVHPNATSGAGTDPTVADASGNISILGSTVAAGINPLRSVATAANSITLQAQISQAIATTDVTKIGLANFNSAQFTVDANGFVSATGTVPIQFTTDSGIATPSGGNIADLGSGSITTTGSGSTITTALTGLTNHALLVGAGTATITKVGPTATAGQVLQSAGSLADPAFSTATYPSTATGTGTILRADGTNWVATTATYPNTTTINQLLYSSANNVVGGITAANNGTLISSTTGVPSWLANGTTGQVLTATTGSPPSWASPAASSISITGDSGGALTGNAFTFTGGTTGLTFSGATSTETLTGTLIVANGGTGDTSFTAYSVICGGTTSTNPLQNVSGVGTSGQVLTSNGAGTLPTWQAAGGGGLLSVSWTLTSAEIKALHGTPKQVIAAPGSGKMICLVDGQYSKYTYGGSNVFTAGAGQTITLSYGTNGSGATIATNTTLTAQTTTVVVRSSPGTSAGIAFTSFDNQALLLYNPSATEISGNAGNNNTMSGTILYYIVTF